LCEHPPPAWGLMYDLIFSCDDIYVIFYLDKVFKLG
jgi:hypothetical protein